MIVQESYNSCQELKLKFSKFQKPQWQLYAQVKLDPPPKRPSGLLLDQENGDIYILNLQVGELNMIMVLDMMMPSVIRGTLL